jgi:hypothetical protein
MVQPPPVTGVAPYVCALEPARGGSNILISNYCHVSGIYSLKPTNYSEVLSKWLVSHGEIYSIGARGVTDVSDDVSGAVRHIRINF